MSERSFHDASAWPCTGALCPCIRRQPPKCISARRPDDYGVPNDKVTSKLLLRPAKGSTTPYGCPMFAPAYVGRKRWAKPFDSLSSLLVSRITWYLVDTSIEATAYPSLKGTGPGPYMTSTSS